MVIKTVPGKKYLTEIRKAYAKKDHENSKVVELFKMNHHFIRAIQVFDRKQLNKWSKMDVVAMTPLTWHPNGVNANHDMMHELTVDLLILVGQKKKEYSHYVGASDKRSCEDFMIISSKVYKD